MKLSISAAVAATVLSSLTLGAQPAAAAGETRVTEVQSRPSFNCSRARTRVEHLICGDTYLGQLDREMAQAYAAFQRRMPASERARLREDQRRWLADRNSCATVDCLVSTYEPRIVFLNNNGRY